MFRKRRVEPVAPSVAIRENTLRQAATLHLATLEDDALLGLTLVVARSEKDGRSCAMNDRIPAARRRNGKADVSPKRDIIPILEKLGRQPHAGVFERRGLKQGGELACSGGGRKAQNDSSYVYKKVLRG